MILALPVLLMTRQSASSASPAEHFPAPGGRWSAIVDHDAVHLMNDGSGIWIETHEGIRSRRWPAACLDADNPEDDFYALTWESPQRARITTPPR